MGENSLLPLLKSSNIYSILPEIAIFTWNVIDESIALECKSLLDVTDTALTAYKSTAGFKSIFENFGINEEVMLEHHSQMERISNYPYPIKFPFESIYLGYGDGVVSF